MSPVPIPSDCPSSPLADLWSLDPAIDMLNHGSFGACPRVVLEAQQRLRAEMERAPVPFFDGRMQGLLDDSRRALAELIGAPPEDLVFTNNATAGVNAVLRSLRFAPGDEVLVTDHAYNACRNVAAYVAQRSGAKLVVAEVPLPAESPEHVADAVLRRATEQTRLALLDHITSPTAVVFPIAEIVRRLSGRGIDTLVDGAHGPGMVPVDVRQIGAAYYAGTCHKWLCAPKGAGFLYVRPDRQAEIEPPVISHGYNSPRPGYGRFQTAVDWTGTDDPTPCLCVGEAIRFLSGLCEGGIAGLMRRNHALAVAARSLLCERLGVEPVGPESMIGCTAAVRLPDDQSLPTDANPLPGFGHPLHRALRERFKIEVPVYYWPAAPQKLLRISAQAYNTLAQYERLAAALQQIV
jgi:isopenicillin-N epimerase